MGGNQDIEREAGVNSDSSATTSTAASSNANILIIENNHPDAPIRDAAGREVDEADSSPPTPRFIQDENSWKRFKWVPYPVRRWIKAGVKWTEGPPVPRRFRIKPLFPQVQQFPIVLLDKYLPKKLHRAALVLVLYAVWILAFAFTLKNGQSVSEIAEWGRLVKIGCGSTYWIPGNGCGLDGIGCRPFDDGGFPFRCPGNCGSYQVLNPHAVGDQEVVYKPLVVGGPPADGDGPAIYRGDSFICGSAIHAGVISDSTGGCGVVRLVGLQSNYNSTKRNGITSVPFDSYFPLSFTFEPDVQCSSRDPRWSLLAISVVFTTVFSLFVSHPGLFFFTQFNGLFWTVGLAMDTPNYTDLASLFSREIGLYLPAMFVAWVMYDKMGIRRTLKGLTAHIEKTILWLGGAWVGSLTNYTFDFIPIQRLNSHDINQQPGAKAALAIIIIVLFFIVMFQIWFFRQEARLRSHLKLYGLFAIGLIICLVLPDLNLRIHHYILALLLLPGTSIQTRPSLLFQGLLLGLFINGIARWGFDPVLQTALALRGDAPMQSPLPVINEPEIEANNKSITFSWEEPPSELYDGISVLVNDVERFRSYFDDSKDVPGGVGDGVVSNVTWTRPRGLVGGEEPEYFRFAWVMGGTRGDYTKAGRWDGGEGWTEMRPGPALKGRGEGDDGEGRGVGMEEARGVMGDLRKRGV
ncbi:hypothetical protein QBC40DRAFT_346373 [Triangularia verruculosa]|uniref:LCCL domain-containing protein n=1 Tax=Triangularia verruculosa TaxID=2587418 RepID=A0AAN7AY55_9PEZI|nr:hypothetical protein QBC40DRAFT_346373 [Triangularia verruculosa]